MKNPITPAGMTYERAFEIAVAAVDLLAAPPDRHDAEIRELNARGFSDRAIAASLRLPTSTTNRTRTQLGLPTRGKGGRRAA